MRFVNYGYSFGVGRDLSDLCFIFAPEIYNLRFMVKNWLILGDEAFDSNDTPLGIFKFTLEEMKDWQSIAWKQFANVVNNNEIVKRMVFGCNHISLSGLFYKKSGVVLEHLNDFARAIASECDNLEYGHADIEYDTKKDTNMLFISFYYWEPEMVNSEPSEFSYILVDKVFSIQINSDSLFF